MTAVAADSMPTGQSAELLAELATPSKSYVRRTWLAAASLVGFIALYAMLAGWFGLTAYRLAFGASPSGKDVIWGYLVGACAAFLAVFMLKAFFFVKRGSTEGTLEVTPTEQPGLFEFLHRVADAAGAPRPHRVFLSARVNAAVFYDLSILNLILPSRKNLEIGLGLVNALSLGELRAVLAHEFGHFRQRTMAVGRWGYIAQQIAAHLIAKRDRLDAFLRALGNFDLRVAWVGWLLNLIVWSIRSLVDSAFRVVLLMQHALSREMELHADRVAVALTGSDALVHALHRMQAADDSWQRAAGFLAGEKSAGRAVRDLFAVQSNIMASMARVMSDPTYGRVPPLPDVAPEQHRIFKADLAQPPRMWLTHPLNHEREANAKQRYVAAPIDERSAWSLFAEPENLRTQVTALLFDTVVDSAVPLEQSLERLNEQFGREHLKSRYRGIYWGRSAVRHAGLVDELYNADAFEPTAADQLYPASLSDDIEHLRTLERELEQLKSLKNGASEATGGVIRHRGRELRRDDLPAAIQSLKAEFDGISQRLQAHDAKCRTWHLNAARHFGQGWPEYMQGLLAVLHYADHTTADLRDAQSLLGNVVAIETAARQVNAAGIDRIVRPANALYASLEKVFLQQGDVKLDGSLLARASVTDWAALLGEFKLLGATRDNIGEWLKIIDSWVDQAAGALTTLQTHALAQLLEAEDRLADHIRQGTAPEAALPASQVPSDYATLRPGNERERITRLSWWARFQTAQGPVAAGARFAVAAGIVGATLVFGQGIGNARVTIYNGLGQAVTVKVGSSQVDVGALSSAHLEIDAGHRYAIEAHTARGDVIESFSEDVGGNFANAVYNVAGASPLVEWVVAYGNAQGRPPRMLGTARWSTSDADVLFAEPPTSVSTKSGGAMRVVLSGGEDRDASDLLRLVEDTAARTDMIRAHVRWDDTQSRHALEWLWSAVGLPDFGEMLKERLAKAPRDVVLLRMEQDTATDADKAAVCERHAGFAKAAPDDAGLLYLALRCRPDSPEKDQALIAAYRRWPNNGWIANGAGYAEATLAHWEQAQAAMEVASRRLPMLADSLAAEIVRVRRIRGIASARILDGLNRPPEWVRTALAFESDGKIDDPDAQAYQALAHGRLNDALRLARGRTGTEARMLRLVAASDGATPELASRAMALHTSAGIDASTALFSAALAARTGRDYEPYLQQVAGNDEFLPGIRAFIEALRKGASPVDAERLLGRLTPQMQGYALGIGAVMLGQKAPHTWRTATTRLLFAHERPYFG